MQKKAEGRQAFGFSCPAITCAGHPRDVVPILAARPNAARAVECLAAKPLTTSFCPILGSYVLL